jgi:hypothetical protein
MKRQDGPPTRLTSLPLFAPRYGTGSPALPPDPAAVAALSPELQHRYHERAAMHEYDGHLPREEAEARAWAAIASDRRREAAGLPSKPERSDAT